MSSIPVKNILVGLAMAATAVIALTFKIAPLQANQGIKVDLETMIPKQFGEWRVDESIQPLSISPDQDAALRKIYSQILTRTYVSNSEKRIMLSVVYGDGIDRQLDIHRPEICYPAQGFSVSRYTDQVISTLSGELSLRRLVATNGPRVEPISYWVNVGSKSVNSSFERKFQKIKQGLTGGTDSGILARISSIGSNQELAYQEQEAFINAMLQSMPMEMRKQLIGD
jgi:EpsI family protein